MAASQLTVKASDGSTVQSHELEKGPYSGGQEAEDYRRQTDYISRFGFDLYAAKTGYGETGGAQELPDVAPDKPPVDDTPEETGSDKNNKNNSSNSPLTMEFWKESNIDAIKSFLNGHENGAEIIFNAIKLGHLLPDPNNPVWGKLYVDGKATDAQREANKLYQSWIEFGGMSADDLFMATISGRIVADANDLRWRALYLYDEYGGKLNASQQQQDVVGYRDKYFTIEKKLESVPDSEFESALNNEASKLGVTEGSVVYSTLLGSRSYETKHIVEPVVNSILDTAVMRVGNKNISVTSRSSGLLEEDYVYKDKTYAKGTYNYFNDGTQCVDLVKTYVKDLSGDSYASTGNGWEVANFLDGKGAGDGMVFKTYSNGNSTPPTIGSVISGYTNAANVGHVALVKGVKFINSEKIEITLIENNYGDNVGGVGRDIKNRKIELTMDADGKWAGELMKGYDIVSWANPESVK